MQLSVNNVSMRFGALILFEDVNTTFIAGRRYAITGRPDLGMPAFDGKDGRPPDFRPLNSAEINDLVALLAYWRLGGQANGK